MNIQIPGIIKITVFFALGIFLYHFFQNPPLPFWLYSLAAIAFAALVFFHNYNKDILHKNIFFGISSFLLFTSLGFIKTYHFQAINDEKHFSRFENIGALKIQLNDLVDSNGKKYIKSTASVLAIKSAKKWQNGKGEILIYFKNEDFDKNELKIGDIFIYSGDLNDLWENKNPVFFDYKEFLNKKNIYAQVYLNQDNSRKIGNDKTPLLHINAIREIIIKKFDENLKTEEAKGLMAALLVGYRGWLGTDVKSSFSKAGLIHVLAVSGLHVGIVFLIMSKLLFFLDKKYPKTKILFIVLFIWFYVFLAGLSPSVFRAGVMFTFISLAKLSKKNINIYTNLFASALVLLLVNPNLLFDAGFQLSYMAVAGIVFFYPKLKNRFLIGYHNRISAFFSDLLLVAIAAQISTLPFILFYFNQFPNYFFLTNVLLMPLLLGLIYFGFFASILLFFNFANEYIAYIIDFLSVFLVKSVSYMSQLPYSITENIYINKIVFTSLILMLIFFVFHINTNKLKYIKYILVLIFVIVVNEIYADFYFRKQRKLIFYNDYQSNVFSVVNGNKAIVFQNDSVSENIYLPALKLKEVKSQEIITLNDLTSFHKLKNLMLCTKNNVVLINRAESNLPISILNWDKNMEINKNLEVDFICVSNNSKPPFETQKYLKSKSIIISSNNYFIKDWVNFAHQIDADLYNTTENGYLEIDI
jgi:competence protein ComEC